MWFGDDVGVEDRGVGLVLDEGDGYGVGDVELGGQDVVGYFALAVSFPKAYWVLVPTETLDRRRTASGNALLEALSDRELSKAWTQAHFALLEESGRVIRERPFEHLAQLALTGQPL